MQISHACPSKEGGSTKETMQVIHTNIQVLLPETNNQITKTIVHLLNSYNQITSREYYYSNL